MEGNYYKISLRQFITDTIKDESTYYLGNVINYESVYTKNLEVYSEGNEEESFEAYYLGETGDDGIVAIMAMGDILYQVED
jgi:hypothetical protein